MTLRLRTEETGGRAAPLRATPTTPPRWVGSHQAVARGGSARFMVAGGLGTGAIYGAVIGDASQVPRMVGAALVQVPAVWVLVGVACALFGVVPRWAVAAWALLAFALVVAMFGTLLDLPSAVTDLSPFQHSPQSPARAPTALPIVALLVVGAALTAVGLLGFRRRDVG
jgi:ABC-2 type transport system permease protein